MYLIHVGRPSGGGSGGANNSYHTALGVVAEVSGSASLLSVLRSDRNNEIAYLKHGRAIKEFIEMQKADRNLREAADRMGDPLLYRWQRDLLSELSGTPDPRKILWYVDGTSNTGKTFVSRVLVTRGGCVRFENGRSADIKFAYRGNMAFNYANSELCVSVIPALPCQTSVRLHHGHLKQLIVQLTNGNILAQGRKCCSSVQKEFKCLLAVVYTLYTSVSHQQKSGIEPPSHQQQKTPKVSTPATLPCLL